MTLFTAREQEEYTQGLARAQERYRKVLEIAQELYAEGLFDAQDVYWMVDTAGKRIYEDSTWLARDALERAVARAERKAEEHPGHHCQLETRLQEAQDACFEAIEPAEEAYNAALDEAERIGK
jgi:hypothetical protein